MKKMDIDSAVQRSQRGRLLRRRGRLISRSDPDLKALLASVSAATASAAQSDRILGSAEVRDPSNED